MPYLNEAEREKLLQDLSTMSFKKAKAKLRRMDDRGKIAIYRNVQNTGEWLTRYDLFGLGTRVTLIESYSAVEGDPSTRNKADFELQEVIVEPMESNRT